MLLQERKTKCDETRYYYALTNPTPDVPTKDELGALIDQPSKPQEENARENGHEALV